MHAFEQRVLNVRVPPSFFVALDARAGVGERRVAFVSGVVPDRAQQGFFTIRPYWCRLAPGEVLANVQRLDRFQWGGRIIEERDQVFHFAFVIELRGLSLGGNNVDHIFFSDIAESDDFGDKFGRRAVTLELRVLHDRQPVIAPQRNFFAVLSASVVIVEDPAAGFFALPQPGNGARFTWSSSHVSWPYVISIRVFPLQTHRPRLLPWL
ncbi:hypothetical protein D3C81_985170 [compost metagenome]